MVVKNVKFNNNKVEIILEDKSFFVSKENYIENPVSIDSYIDEKKINFLLEQEHIIQSKNEIIKILNKKVLSEKEIVTKLKEKELKIKDIDVIVDSLKRMGLVNDEYYAQISIDYLISKRKGKLEILKYLKEKGIAYEIVSKCVDEIDDDIYNENFRKVCDKYLKIYNNKSCRLKEKMVINKLREYGYEDELISTINLCENNEEEKQVAKMCLCKLLKAKKISLDNFENIQKIRTKLAMKGFSYDIINLVIEEVCHDETY